MAKTKTRSLTKDHLRKILGPDRYQDFHLRFLKKYPHFIESVENITHQDLITTFIIYCFENEFDAELRYTIQSFQRKTKKDEWKNVQQKKAISAKKEKQKKTEFLLEQIRISMGSNSGKHAQLVARDIEKHCVENKIKPPYSTEGRKNGKSSLLRNIEIHLPAIRKKIQNGSPIDQG